MFLSFRSRHAPGIRVGVRGAPMVVETGHYITI